MEMHRRMQKGESELMALEAASQHVLREQTHYVMIPRRFSLPMREIWMLQPRLARRTAKRAYRHFEHKRFRAAYDFLLLRAEVGEEDPQLAEWWTRFQEVDDAQRAAMVRELPQGAKRRRPRRRRKPKSH
jgi:poly(A) polymerase